MRPNSSLLKQVLSVLFFFICPVLLFSQQPDSIPDKPDSTIITDSVARPDSLKLSAPDSLIAQRDTAGDRIISYTQTIQGVIKENTLLSPSATPVSMVIKTRNLAARDNIFYLILIITAFLAFFRFFYTRYFNNLFRVFFNASLRQSQLTDQLLQAKLQSLFFNIVFILSGGTYVYLLLIYYNWVTPGSFWMTVLYCIASLAVIYIVKFISLKFTGWLTGYREVTNTYIFIIFLVNKILGILLLPFIILMAFSSSALVTGAVITSLLLTSLMFLLRFFRSYGLLEHQLKISRYHFFMYVLGVEIIPLLLIYKGLVLLLSKNG